MLMVTGYNFKSLEHISPCVEPTTDGVTAKWARRTASEYRCVVAVGYPEKTDVNLKEPEQTKLYNSVVTVDSKGTVIGNYRKTFLYYTDATWAEEGPDGFFSGEIEGLGNTAMGICKFSTSRVKVLVTLNIY
jgi:protein N-terminal amidase